MSWAKDDRVLSLLALMLMCLQYLYVSCLTFKSEMGFYDMVLKSFQRMTFGKEGMQEIMLLYFYPLFFSVSSNLLRFFKIECIVTGIWDTS